MDKARIKYGYYVFDVETTKLEPMAKNFVFGVVYGYNYRKVINTVNDFKKEFEHERYKNKYVFAHNAEFDLLTIFGNIIKNIDNSAVFNGKFIMAKYKDVTFADSMNIYPTSVAKIGEMLDLLKLSNEKVRSEGLTKANVNKDDIDYCIRDCKIIFLALLEIFESVGDIKLTLASLSMYQFRSKYLVEDIMFSEVVDEFYESYYGGRTEAFHIGKVNAKVYDINSMYSFAMINTVFPDIKHLKKVYNIDVKYLMFLMDSYEGMCKVTVRHENTYFGYLPCKMKINDSEKLVFPVGVFTTTVNFNELNFAIEKGVVEVLKIEYAVYGNPVESPFKVFINDNYKEKIQAKSKIKALIHKNIMNSLYGRFAMRMKLQTTYYEDLPFEIVKELQDSEKFYELQLFNKERNDCYLITENEQMKASFFSIPTYSSYITSAARVYLLKALIANEKNSVCYCDTDSIFLSGNFNGSVSDSIGDFKLEEKNIIEIRGLKNYSYVNEAGQTTNVIKGISKGSIKKEGCTVPTYETKKYIKTKQAIQQDREAGTAYIMVKELKHDYDKRIIEFNGTTKPLQLPIIQKPVIKKKIFTNYEPYSYYEAILMFFVQGGKIKKQDVISEITGKSKEINLYKGIVSDNGVPMDSFNEYVSELLAVDRPVNYFIDILSRFYNKTQMKKELKRIKIPDDNLKLFIEKQYDYPF